MNRKILLIAGGAVAALAIVAGAIVALVGLNGGKPASEQYVASEIHALRIVQQGASSYDVSFELPEGIGADDLSVSLADTPEYGADADRLGFAVDGDRVQLDTADLDPGDHFVWVSSGDIRASATVTIPDISPRVWLAEDVPTIEFGESGDSSWSSYVDPEGKSVYRSASPVFDADDAEPLAEDLAITETSYRIDDVEADLPYYFLVFTGHSGDSTFVSSPLIASAEQGDLAVDLSLVDGEPSYTISGFLASRKQDDVERTTRLRVGNYDAADPSSTFFVENTAEEADGTGRFRFVVPATELADGYSDLAVFLQEDGATLEWSLDATGVDISKRLVSDGSVFGFRRAEALQLTRIDLVYERLQVTLAGSGDSARLHVSGTFTEEASAVGYQLVVKDTGGESHVVDDGASTARNFSYSVDLANLQQASVWYDVEFLDPSDGSSSPISTLSVADMTQWVATSSRTYAFADYDGLLKVFFDDAPFANAHVELSTIGGVPSLVATGDLVGTANSDAFLRIRTGDTVVQDVANSASARGEFRFVFDLRTLPSPDVWFDVAFRKASTDTVKDFRASAANLNQTLEADSRSYAFHEWDGQLKVAYSAIAGTVDISSVQLVDAAGTPTLQVEGTLDGIAAGDARLRIRTGSQVLEATNSATVAGAAHFVFDLTGLTQSGTWYDVLTGSASADSFADVPTTGVDLTQSLTLGGRAYGLHEWNGQLKVSFDDVSRSVDVSTAEIVDENGTPTLRVTGSVEGTANADTFLRIRAVQATTLAQGTGDVAALTFDDGPNGDDTNELLDFLAEKNIRAVFCVIGENIEAPGGAEVLRRIVAEGHTLCNHSTSYDDMGSWTEDQIRADLLENLQIIRDALGDPDAQVPFFRAPNGSWGATPAVAVSLGMQPIGVVNTINDWYTQDQTTLEDNLRAALTPGEIVLVHDGGGDRSGSVAAVKTVVQERLDAGWSFTLPVGTPTGDNAIVPVSYVDVPNTAAVEGDALFEYDLTGLLQAGVWNDLVVGIASTQQFTDLDAAIADLDQTVSLGGRAYGFHEWSGQLKVAFEDVGVSVVADAVTLDDVDGVATLRVTGSVTGTSDDDAFLRIRSGAQTIDVPNTSGVAGEALFEYPLAGLTQAGTWYDLLVGITSTGALTDLTSELADLDQTVSEGERDYGFREWYGDLKVMFADTAPAVAITSAEIVDESDTPTLRLAGSVVNTTNDDVFLRITTSDQTIDVANSATTSGEVLFETDLSALTEEGTWYDVVIGITSRGTLTELPSSIADLDQSVGIAGRTYTFEEWYGVLKVAFDNVTLASGQSLRIDFGPDDTTNGVATSSPDVNGRYWNNVIQAGGSSNTVPSGRNVASLVTTDGTVTTTEVTMNGTNWKSNGILQGGLTSPSSALLGEYAIATATEDYFFVENQATATLTLSGLDPWQEYDLSFFGTRNATGVRETKYTVTGSNGSQVATLQTSGTGIGAGGYNGNNNTIVSVQDIQPESDGTLTVSILATKASPNHYAYLGFLEITGDTALTPIPDEVSRWVAQDAADPLADDSVLFIGSSSIRRWEVLTRDFADYDIIQRGWGGSWLSGVNDYSPWVAWPYQPSAIVMWAGTNDLNGGEDAQWVLDEFREFVTNMRANSPGSELLWISITPNPGNVALNEVRMETNALIKAEIEADTTGTLHYIDIASYFEQVRDTDPTLFASYYVDSLHMTRAGYAKWLEYVRPALEAVVSPNKVAMVNPDTLQDGEKLFFDFGPNDGSEGDATTVDANGNHWNNWVDTGAGELVNVGEHITGLVDSTGADTGIGVTIASGFRANGKTTGGLLSPSSSLLGELGVASATEDFFYSSADGVWGGSDDDLPGGLMITGLDPDLEYEFQLFGSRSSTETRVTRYDVYGATSGTASLQTSGTGISADGTKNGNDDEVAVVSGIRPDAYGQVWIDLTVAQGSYAYLNALEVVASTPEPEVQGFSTFVLNDDSLGAGDAEEVEPAEPETGELADDESSTEDQPADPEDTPAAPDDPAVVPGGSASMVSPRRNSVRADAGGRRRP